MPAKTKLKTNSRKLGVRAKLSKRKNRARS